MNAIEIPYALTFLWSNVERIIKKKTGKLLLLPLQIIHTLSIKKLAGQTLWYGLSNIVGRFLNFFLTSILLAWLYKPEGIAAVSQVYVIVPFLNIIFTLGLETTYFRFSQLIDKQKLFNTLNTFLVGTSLLFTILLMAGKQPMTHLFDMQRSTDYYIWMIWIVCIDTLSTIPFAKLRHEGRPKKFALIKFMNIMWKKIIKLPFYKKE